MAMQFTKRIDNRKNLLIFKLVFWVTVILCGVILMIHVVNRIGYTTTHLDSYYGTEWVCEDPEISVKVYDVLGVRGKMTVDDEEIEFIMHHHGGACWIAFSPENPRDYPELETGYYITGGAYWKKGNYCINIENDYIGLGTDKLIFKQVSPAQSGDTIR